MINSNAVKLIFQYVFFKSNKWSYNFILNKKKFEINYNKRKKTLGTTHQDWRSSN